MIVKYGLILYIFYYNTLNASMPGIALDKTESSTFTICFTPVNGQNLINFKIDKQNGMTWFDLLACVARILKNNHNVDAPIDCLTVYGLHIPLIQGDLYSGPEEQLIKCVPHTMKIINVTQTEHNNNIVRNKILEAFNKQISNSSK